MISDAIKKKSRYKYYMSKKVEMNFPNKLKKDDVPRKIRSVTIAEEAVVSELANSANMYSEWGHKLKGLAVEDPTVQSLLDLQKGSKASRLKSLRRIRGSAKETDDADGSDMDLSDENPHGDDDDASSLQAKAKKLMQKAKKNMRKFTFKKAVTQKFKEYDQRLEDLKNFNVSEAFEKSVQAKVLTEIKKLLPTHIPNAIANYLNSLLNTSVLEDPYNNREGENKKKRQKDVGEPSSRSSRRNRSLVVIVQDDTPAMQPL
nr:hypothetical protein [Tanacetum cinerariifolium]